MRGAADEIEPEGQPVREGVEGTPEARPVEAGLTLRAFCIAVVLTFLCGIWVRQAEIVVLATQITESVPPIPALAVLLMLVLLRPLLGLLGKRFALTRGEI